MGKVVQMQEYRDWREAEQAAKGTPVVKVRPAQATDLVHWPFIRAGLASIKARQGHRSTWTPEHVRAALVGQGGQAPTAELWLATIDDKPVAFTITQSLVDGFLHIANGLFIWFAYSKPEVSGTVRPIMDAYMEQIARERGCSYIEAYTARPGLGRALKRHGWVKVLEVLRKPLYEDA